MDIIFLIGLARNVSRRMSDRKSQLPIIRDEEYHSMQPRAKNGGRVCNARNDTSIYDLWHVSRSDINTIEEVSGTDHMTFNSERYLKAVRKKPSHVEVCWYCTKLSQSSMR